MSPPIRVLLVEDSPYDAEMVVRALQRAGLELEWRRVDNEAQFLGALEEPHDIVLSDFGMPQFDGLRALELLRARDQETPFILVSGSVGEETAVEAMKQGAADYLLKDRLARLGPSVKRALLQRKLHRERQRSVDGLRESEERFRQLAENIYDVFWMTDASGKHLQYVSPAYQKIWGRPVPASPSQQETWLESLHPADRARMEAAIHRQAAGTYDEEYRILRPDGSVRWIHDRAFPVRNEAGEIQRVVGVASDITERKQAETRIREQAEILDRAHDAILVADIDTRRITFWNQGAERIYGWSASEVLGWDYREFLFAEGAPDDDVIVQLQASGEWRGDVHHLAKSGSKLLLSSHATLLRDPQDKPTSALFINIDVTVQRSLELQLLRGQRMESLGTLAGGIAHDLNNVLAPILMGVQLLQSTLKEESRPLLDMLEASCRRGAGLVKQVLTFARGVEGDRHLVNPQDILADLERIIHDTFPKRIAFHFAAPPNLWPVVGDSTQIYQVVMNLCVNARDAMARSGKLTLAAENVTLDEGHARQHPGSRAGKFLLIRVTDTGSGIPPEIRERIFDPFFTTKPVGESTGLGLSTSLGIVRSHDGFVQVESEPGRGSTFKVYFPAVLMPGVEVAFTEEKKLPRGHGQLVLVVDDEEAIRIVTQKTLERFGYRVLLAVHGAEAVSLYARYLGEVAVVLTDMEMAVLDGPATIIALRAINPDVKIISSSGLSAGSGAGKSLGSGALHFIQKPYTADSLLSALARVLNLQE